MKPQWPMIALCIGVFAASAPSAAFPTKDEYVVFADSNTTVRSTVPVDTTEKPRAPIKLTEMRVRSEVALRYARTTVLTHVQNPDARPQEVTFRMLLPDTAFISGFTMILSGKSYKAYVKEKEEAKQIYTQAVSQGLSAAHVATKARDSNHFTVSVNVEGNTTAVFDLKYEEFLVRRNGLYNHAINLHPGAFVPKMEVVVNIKESQKITQLRVPEVRTGNEVDATEKDAQNSKAVIQRATNDKEATVTFTPDLSEQRRLAEIYVEKTKQKGSSYRYIGYSSTEGENDQDVTVLGQFVVQYDVERTNNGEILVNDGYFVHFLAPTSLPPLSKHAIFVLDTSGSMMGRKIEQLRNAMKAILSDLNPNDYFSIVEFNTAVKVHELKEADEEPPPRTHYSHISARNTSFTQVPPSLATAENIAKAKVIVSRLNAFGGTNIYSALKVAFDLVRKGTQKENETDSSAAVADGTSTTDATAEREQKIEKQLEPMVIFLTDGDPTFGETSTPRIISFITEKNSGDQRAALYSLAFGEDADRVFLRKLSLRNEGFMRHIYEAADAALQLHDFYRQVSSPLLSHVQFLYPEKQIKEGSVSRNKFHTINAGSEVAVVGQIADDVTELTSQVQAFCGEEDGKGRKRYEISTKVAVTRAKDEYLPLERLWAYLTIKQLLDKRDAADDAADDSAEKKALAIALKYEFVTPLTSLVVVKPEETNAVDVESVDKTPGDSSTAYRPMGLSGPPRPSNAYINSNHASFGQSAFSSLPGLSSYYYAGGNIQPLALDAANIPDALIDVENDYDSKPIYYYSSPWRTDLSFSSKPGGYYGNGNRLRGSAYPPVRGYASSASGMTISFVPSTTPRPAVTDATTTAPSSEYHLELFAWTSSLLSPTNDALVFDVNGTEVTLKLSKDVNAPKADSGDTECSNSTSADGTANVCVYLTRCYGARSITAEDYQKSYCIVDNRYAGVCCARADVDKNP